MSDEFTTYRFQITMALPCIREVAVRDALLLLPESSPENIPGYRETVIAAERLTALEALVKTAEAQLAAASRKLRERVERDWTAGEIPAETARVLSCW